VVNTANRDQRVDAAHLRHLDVEQRHVGANGAKLLDRFASGRGLCHELHVALRPYECRDSRAEQGMIVCGQHTDRVVGFHEGLRRV
jgi:hypothetical protein